MCWSLFDPWRCSYVEREEGKAMRCCPVETFSLYMYHHKTVSYIHALQIIDSHQC